MDSPQPDTFLPQVSVVIPIYNGETDLPELLACLQAQTYPRDRVEYLLVDNASQDRTAVILQQAAESAQAEGLNLHHLTEAKIQSAYAARNTAIRAAAGKIFVFTDADCRPQPNWLELLVPPFADPTIGLVVGEIAAFPGKTLLERYADSRNLMSQKDTLAHPFCPYGQTANLAIRRQALEQVGLFRPYMTTGGDADICWRIQKQTTWQLHFAEQAIVQHRHRATLKDLKSQWQRYGRSNRYLHELYGVGLTRKHTWRESVYLLSRWFLKELPSKTSKTLLGKAPAIELINTPISVYCARARTAGQQAAKLSEQATEIEWL